MRATRRQQVLCFSFYFQIPVGPTTIWNLDRFKRKTENRMWNIDTSAKCQNPKHKQILVNQTYCWKRIAYFWMGVESWYFWQVKFYSLGESETIDISERLNKKRKIRWWSLSKS